jgi:hypothetical protein
MHKPSEPAFHFHVMCEMTWRKFHEAVSVTAKESRQPRCPSLAGQLNEMCIATIKYYEDRKKTNSSPHGEWKGPCDKNEQACTEAALNIPSLFTSLSTLRFCLVLGTVINKADKSYLWGAFFFFFGGIGV